MLRKICLILALALMPLGVQGKDPNAALFEAIKNENYEGVVAAIKHGADVNIRRKKDGFSPLIESAMHDNVKIMNYLLSKGANVNAQDKSGQSALYWVSFADSIGKNPLHGKEMALALLKAQANVYLTNEDGYTALMWSAGEGRSEMVRLLGKAGAVNFQDEKGWTALMEAARKGHVQTVHVLLTLQADPNLKDNLKGTALHWAAYKGHTKIVKDLLNHGAAKSLYFVDSDGNTPLSLAERHNHKEVASLLRQAGAVR